MKLLRPIFIFIIVLVLFTSAYRLVWDSPSDQHMRQDRLLILLDQQFLSSYLESNQKFGSFNIMTQKFCQSPSENTLDRVKKGYQEAQMAWSQIEWINFGPIEQNLNYFKVYLWPDKRGQVAEQIRTAFASSTNYPKTLEDLRKKNIALQGLHTVEQMIYDPKITKQKLDQICPILPLISKNITEMVSENAKTWKKNIAVIRTTLKKQLVEKPVDHRYTEIELLYLENIFQAYLGQLEKIQKLKLPPMIENKIKYQEGYLSDRTLSSLKSNYFGLEHLTNKKNGIGSYLVDSNPSILDIWQSKLAEITKLLNTQSSALKKDQLEDLSRKNEDLIKWSQETLARELGLPSGF